jgi:hypothetical protein
VTYVVQRDDERLECSIDVGHERVGVRFLRATSERLRLDVRGVAQLRVERDEGGERGERLRASFDDSRGLIPLVVDVRPRLRVAWGSNDLFS